VCDSGESVASAMGRDSGDGPRDSGLREGGGSRSVVEASVACIEVLVVKSRGLMSIEVAELISVSEHRR